MSLLINRLLKLINYLIRSTSLKTEETTVVNVEFKKIFINFLYFVGMISNYEKLISDIKMCLFNLLNEMFFINVSFTYFVL